MTIRTLAAACLFSLLLAVPAPAYVLDRRPSGPRSITFHSEVDQSTFAVDRALAAWSASGAEIDFIPVPREQAEVLITYRPGPPALAGETTTTYRDGHASTGPGETQVELPRFAGDAAAHKVRFVMASLAAHELGHALGLQHEDRGCAVMNTWILNEAPEHCRQPPPGQWRCGLLAPDDVAAAVRLYGGRARASRRTFCPKSPGGGSGGRGRPESEDGAAPAPRPKPDLGVPMAPAGLVAVAAPLPAAAVTKVRWRTASDPRARSVAVVRGDEGCSLAPPEHTDAWQRGSAPPGAVDSTIDFTFPTGDPAGDCYSAWSRDAGGRWSRETTAIESLEAGA